MHQFIHTLSVLLEGEILGSPTKEYDGSCKDSASIIFDKRSTLVPVL